MKTHSTTICLHCGQIAQVAPGFCILCGQSFPTQLPAPLPNYQQTVELRKAA